VLQRSARTDRRRSVLLLISDHVRTLSSCVTVQTNSHWLTYVQLSETNDHLGVQSFQESKRLTVGTDINNIYSIPRK